MFTEPKKMYLKDGQIIWTQLIVSPIYNSNKNFQYFVGIIIDISEPKKDRKKPDAYPQIQNSTIICRLIKVELENGETEILCTSLTDNEKYSFTDFKELYHYRWNEKEDCKLLKIRIEVENFSDKTARVVRQDFFAKVFLMTLCAAYSHPIEEKVITEYKADNDRKYGQKINRTNALAATQNILISLMIKNQFQKALEAFDKIVENTREIVRPGRSFVRNKRPKKPYSMNYNRL